jgi:glutathione S-transferase
MTRDMRIDATGAELGRRKTLAALDRIEAEIGPAGYLVGERFTIADLTAAALFSVLVMPPEFPYPLPAPVGRCAELREAIASRPGFAWLHEMYRRHRGASHAVAA